MSQQAEHGSSKNSSSDEAISLESHVADLISKLPSREGLSERMVLYKNYWLRPYFVESVLCLQNSFKPRHDDIILASNPKCGTRLRSHQPLPEVVPFIEIPRNTYFTYLENLPSPRLLATHLPLSLFPKSTTCGCRVVYICRDPKDAFVSRCVDLETAFNMFSKGFSGYGSFWDHCLEYWRESIAMPDRALKYEEMLSDPVKHVIKIAAFIGVPFSTKEEEDGVPDEMVRLCSFEKLSSLYVNKTGEFFRHGNMVIENSAYFRKAKVGDWQNHINEEMGRKLDCIVKEKLKGSGLTL
ncbi:hypothetical protein SORBI_3003G437001 [Sorghum bicolor]|uniref:Sulfotransferase n=1 Tax=Sorghum bicolor TaxID=4558 RepID=A0A1W0W1J8_SORBI|nr:hypothetical protein SORBI_3003G437001 [Sorghum bicolor]